jgi:hypothetical protein
VSAATAGIPDTRGTAGGWADRLRTSRVARWQRPLLHGAVLASVVWVATIALGWFELGTDVRAYWLTGSEPWYEADLATLGAFTYSPAIGQLLAPFVALPWPVFAAGFAAVSLAALFAIGGRWSWLLLLLPFTLFELYAGNIHLLLTLAIVVGFRYPAAWAFVLLTKVTPGVGLLWFVVRREWRALVVALGTTEVIVAISFALDPGAWMRWIDFLRLSTQTAVGYPHVELPLLIRVPVAALLVIWGARTDRRWVVPVAAMVALPVIWPGSLVMLLGVLPLLRTSPREPS